jgi:hypothetical protein
MSTVGGLKTFEGPYIVCPMPLQRDPLILDQNLPLLNKTNGCDVIVYVKLWRWERWIVSGGDGNVRNSGLVVTRSKLCDMTEAKSKTEREYGFWGFR